MTVRFYFENIKDPDKRLLENYFHQKKSVRLEKLLRRGSFELSKFTANVKYHRRRNTFIARLGLNFAKNDLTAQEQGRALLEAFDLAFDRLIGQLRKAKFSARPFSLKICPR